MLATAAIRGLSAAGDSDWINIGKMLASILPYKIGKTLHTMRGGGVYVPPALEQPHYDFDGNLTDDARWRYEWDGENRLRAMETQATAVARGVPRQRIECAYDAQWRRVAKKVLRWSMVVNGWTLERETRFVWDGWRLLAELERTTDAGAFVSVRSYTWGLDVSGSLEGAGCVGGLLAVQAARPSLSRVAQSSASGVTSQPVTILLTYDGNGNVTSLVNAAGGSTLARWDYDPFGNKLTDAELAWLELCPFGFSAKYEDGETGLLYYGFRYYSAELGRWLSRDPIAERGGVNVHLFSSNEPTGVVDYLGLQDMTNLADPPGWNCPHNIPVDGGYSMDWDAKTTSNPERPDEKLHFYRIAGGEGRKLGDTPTVGHGTTGADLLEHFKSLSTCCKCVRNFRIATHGGMDKRIDGVDSPGKGKDGGLYLARPPKGRYGFFYGEQWGMPALSFYQANDRYDPGGRGLEDLSESIVRKDVAFCKSCTISIMSCRVRADFIQKLASITGCSVVATQVGCDAPSNPNNWRSFRYRDGDKDYYPNFIKSEGGSAPQPVGPTYSPP